MSRRLSLWVSKSVSHYLPAIFKILAGTVSSGVRKYSIVISSLEIPLSLVGWAVTSLATFYPLMRKNPDTERECRHFKANHLNATTVQLQNSACTAPDWEKVLQKILAAAVVASLVWLGEKFIIQLLSINYHRKQFHSRIVDSKHNIYILGLLFEASRALFPMYCHEFAEEDYTISDQLDLSGKATKGLVSKRMSGSATPLRLLQNVGMAADKITSAFGHVAQEVTGKQVFNPNSAHSIVVEALEKNRPAEALARRIWMSFVVEGKEALFQEDIMDVLGAERKTEAEEAFSVLDRDANGDISLDEMILTVTEFGRERKAIASSLHDVDQAINVLDSLLVAAALLVIVLVFVAFLNESFVSTLATAGTALISLSFVFATSAQEVLGSCIFLFVKHPYDIGDRVDICNTVNTQFVVEHISLLFTTFRHAQGATVGQLCQIPNIVLNTLWVENITRSKAMSEQIQVDIDFGTAFDDLNILKNELLTFVTDKDNSRDYQPTIDLDILGTSDQSKLSLLVEIKHKSNWSNETIRRARRSKFMCALVYALKAVPIYAPGGSGDAAGSPAKPNYAVAITHAEAKEFAQESSKGRQDARLAQGKRSDEAPKLSPVTSDTKSGLAGVTQQESHAVDDLTARDPAVDTARDEAWTSGRDDSSTLGERPSIDRQDLEDVRGLLRRESTRGKRKISSDYHPTIPTINEPDQSSPNQQPYYYQGYSQGQAGGYENQRPGYSTAPSPYRPPMRPQPTQYQSAQSQVTSAGQAAAEMSQVAPQRSPSNPYRQDTSTTRKPLAPPGAVGEEEEDEFGNTRPYSGV